LKIKSQKDFWSGLMFVATGLGFAWGAQYYSFGTSARPGPGYFPFGLGILLALLGALVLFEALTIETDDGEPIGRWAWKPLLTICLGKSTYARCGIIVNVTPFEPEWEGFVTLEFSNTTPLPAKIYANEGVAQVIFFEADEVCETSYKDRGGKYQGQQGVTLPKI